MYVSVIDTNNVGQQAVLGRVDVPLSRLSAISNGVEVVCTSTRTVIDVS